MKKSTAIVPYVPPNKKIVVPEITKDLLKQLDKQEKELYVPKKHPLTGEDYKTFTARINRELNKYQWDRIVIENMCNLPQSSDRIVEFTPSQDFISNYFVPNDAAPNHLPPKGLLVWHSVGTGKTCTAIATKSKTWEDRGYTILWVTRSALRDDIWKNMFDKVCDYKIREKLEQDVDVPEGTKLTRSHRKHMNKKFLDPLSFASFSNVCRDIFKRKEISNAKVVKNLEKLIQINGSRMDPLRKTVVIIDEAHKMLAKDMKGAEKANFDMISKAVQNSYSVSGEESCRLLLMSATPIMDDPMDFVRLLNLLDKKDNAMPTDPKNFVLKYKVNDNFDFDKKAVGDLNEVLKGKISYLDRSYDPRTFTQPEFRTILSEISSYVDSSGDCDKWDEEINAKKEKQAELQIVLDEDIKAIDEQVNIVESLRGDLQNFKDEYEADDKSQKKSKDEKAQFMITKKEKSATLKEETSKLKTMKKALADKVKENKDLKPAAIKKLETAKKKCLKDEKKKLKPANALSQQLLLVSKCNVKAEDINLPAHAIPEKKPRKSKKTTDDTSDYDDDSD